MADNTISINSVKTVNDIIGTIERDREREIVARRFGLFDRKETLEQIGEYLGITRERVRQLEKAAINRLISAGEQGELKGLPELEKKLESVMATNGGVIRIADLTKQLSKTDDKQEQARLAFIIKLCPGLVTVNEDDNFYQSAATSKFTNEKALKSTVSGIVAAIKELGKPAVIAEIAKLAKISDNAEATALATTSKQLACLNDEWGLIKWPLVNPKNIRDKIYVTLKQNGKHMHFSEIAEAIKQSDFKRKDVTVQAIHNELIKDKRFVLVGRGIYALAEWGYKRGTVADIIADVLKKANEPLHRDEIVKRVLKNRYVKETTILLNLQGKPQFKRVAKATYELVDNE